jgi:hypothetical protein
MKKTSETKEKLLQVGFDLIGDSSYIRAFFAAYDG